MNESIPVKTAAPLPQFVYPKPVDQHPDTLVCGNALEFNEDVYQGLIRIEQAKLDAAGLSDVRFTLGHFVHGDKTRFEARISANPETVRTPELEQRIRAVLSFPQDQPLPWAN